MKIISKLFKNNLLTITMRAPAMRAPVNKI